MSIPCQSMLMWIPPILYRPAWTINPCLIGRSGFRSWRHGLSRVGLLHRLRSTQDTEKLLAPALAGCGDSGVGYCTVRTVVGWSKHPWIEVGLVGFCGLCGDSGFSGGVA